MSDVQKIMYLFNKKILNKYPTCYNNVFNLATVIKLKFNNQTGGQS